MANSNDRGKGFFGNPQKHRDAGIQGGRKRKQQMEEEGRSYQELGQLGGEAAQRSGKAHRLTREERARGGKRSHSARRSD